MPEPRDPNLPPETDPVPPVANPPEEPPTPPTPPAIDYEKKFSDSTRENQILQGKIKTLETAAQELTKEPTDSDLKAAFPNWEEMTDNEKMLGRRTFNSERVSQSALATANKFQQEREWQTSLELASTDPALQGKEEAFKKYASKPQYRNVPTDVLVSAFLGTLTPNPKLTPKPGLETGNGGLKEPPKPKGISGDELSALRRNNPREYEKYIKSHPIDVSDL